MRLESSHSWSVAGNQGGMMRWAVTFAISRARLRASAKRRSEKGPAPPGRWDGAQWLKMTGARSRLKVMSPGLAAPAPPVSAAIAVVTVTVAPMAATRVNSIVAIISMITHAPALSILAEETGRIL